MSKFLRSDNKLLDKILELLSEVFLSKLDDIPTTEYAKIYCELNIFKIPESLKNIQPQWLKCKKIDLLLTYKLFPIMEKIESVIGEKACNREWNKNRMSDEEHEHFWNLKRPLYGKINVRYEDNTI